MKDQDPDVQSAAAEALGQLSDPRVVEALISALKDNYWYVRKISAAVLGIISARLEDAALRARIVQLLIAALKDTYMGVPGSAAEALGKLGDRNAVEPLIAALKNSDVELRKNAATALGRLGDNALWSRSSLP